MVIEDVDSLNLPAHSEVCVTIVIEIGRGLRHGTRAEWSIQHISVQMIVEY